LVLSSGPPALFAVLLLLASGHNVVVVAIVVVVVRRWARMMMVRGGTRKHITPLSTTTNHTSRNGTIPRGQIMVERCGIAKHSIHGYH
jgi:hypothetical protein